MIHIGICDDNLHYIDIVHDIITRTLLSSLFEYQVHTYNTSHSFLDGYNNYLFDIVLLDIEIDTQNGLTISQKLQNDNITPIIIFITAHASFMKDAFGYNVYKYILKEELQEVLPKTILQVFNKLTNQQINLPSEDGIISISSHDIKYFKYENRKIYMKIKNQYIQLYITSLKKVFNYIQSNKFIQVSNCYIINLNYVQSIKGGIILMEDCQITIPKGKRKLIYQTYQEFILNEYKHI